MVSESIRCFQGALGGPRGFQRVSGALVPRAFRGLQAFHWNSWCISEGLRDHQGAPDRFKRVPGKLDRNRRFQRHVSEDFRGGSRQSHEGFRGYKDV